MTLSLIDARRSPIDVLVLLGCFARGNEATGPTQNMIGLAQALEGRFRFRILAEAVDGDRPGRWQTVSGLEQMPFPGGLRGVAMLRQAINATPHALLLTNGFFDRRFTLPMLLMRRAGMIRRGPTMVAPHGEFSPGALALGHRRKAWYLRAARHLGLLDGVVLQATSADEAERIRAILPATEQVVTVPNVQALAPLPPASAPAVAEPLKLVFASRVDRMKNLDRALAIMAATELPITFDIFGPVSDERYWAECLRAIAQLPPRVRVTYHGILPHAAIVPTLARYHAMILPTRGENFGHAIADALMAGTPALISDRTPWRKLAANKAGWDLPLDDEGAFVRALRALAAMPAAERSEWRTGARRMAERMLDPRIAADQCAAAFHTALGRAVA